jgi:hypothetical protein
MYSFHLKQEKCMSVTALMPVVVPALKVFQVAGSSISTGLLLRDLLVKQKSPLSNYSRLALAVALVASATLTGFQGLGLGIISLGIQMVLIGAGAEKSKKFALSAGVALIALPILVNRLLGGGVLLPLMQTNAKTEALFAGLIAGLSSYVVNNDSPAPSVFGVIAATITGLMVPHPYLTALGIGIGNGILSRE